MSKEFYNYLAKRTINYFTSSSVISGEKYILKLDNENMVENYYSAINTLIEQNADIREDYVIENDDETFSTIGLLTKNDTKMFIVPEINITNAYLTRLRNTVKEGWAMLIVCYNPIDSIAGGTESIQKEGMPFYREELIKDIRDIIKKSNTLPLYVKCILYADLIKKSDLEDSYSLTDFEDIISTVSKGLIEDFDYKKFMMFSDAEIVTTINDATDIDRRIEDNQKRYKKISDSVRFGEPDKDLHKEYSDDFIKKIKDNVDKKGSWDEGITYADIRKAIKKKEESELPITIENITIYSNGFAIPESEYYVKSESDKGIRKNRKHFLVFNTKGNTDFEMEVTFSDFLKKNDVVIFDKKIDTSTEITGKRFIIRQRHSSVSINRIDLKLIEKKENFQFNFCIINCAPFWFESISTKYLINVKENKKQRKGIVVNCDSDIITINDKAQFGESLQLEDGIDLAYNPEKFLKIIINENSFNDENVATTFLHISDAVISLVFKDSAPTNTSCTGIKIEQYKLMQRQSFVYKGNNKLSLGTDEYNTREELKRNLEFEDFMVKEKCMACIVSGGSIKTKKLNVGEKVVSTYNAMLDYLRNNDTLPSLVYYDDEFIKLSGDYLSAIFAVLQNIEENKPLTIQQQDVLKIGSVYYEDDELLTYSPLHPINVSYRILLTKEALSMKKGIREDVLKKFNSSNLLPLIHNENGEVYKIFEQTHSPQWTYYYPTDKHKLNGSRDFVSTIVREKIVSFKEHFQYLFGYVGGNEMIVNAVNMGDCRNLFIGIVNYYRKEISALEENKKLLTLIVNVYDDNNVYNVFEFLSSKTALKKFLIDLGLKDEEGNVSLNEMLNCLVNNIKYFHKNKTDEHYEYSHLAFIEMDQEQENGYSNPNDIRSGTMLSGLLSGVTSTYYGESKSYRTGYGSKFNKAYEGENNILKLADLYNSAMHVFGTSNPYVSQSAICTYINENETTMIKKTYEASNWVVFIDPKVDLNFFKNTDKDVMIIHYSDQHTASSGYDAITVTKKTKQYTNLLEEYLCENNIVSANKDQIRKIVDMFNAVNGDWLLKLISSKSSFPKEKISIQSAIKLALALFKNDNIKWIPISLEEILRVSGATGLGSSGLFSAKKLGYKTGATSDDLLLFGVEMIEGQVYVHLYPMEVKIGYKNTDEAKKATEQVKHTKKILDNELVGDDEENELQRKFYRNFIAQAAIVSAEKLNLYNVWDTQDWERIINDDIRGMLLNDDFIITDSLRDDIGNGIVMSFKSGALYRDVKKDDDVTIIKFLESDGIGYLTKTIDEIVDNIGVMDGISDSVSKFSCLRTVDDRNSQSLCKKNIISAVGINNDVNIRDDAVNDMIFQNIAHDTIQQSAIKTENGMQILFGHDVNTGEPLYWYPNDTEKVYHPNTGIIGTMGTGKTQFTKSLILQLVREQKNNPGDVPLGILIFDYKGDYNKKDKEEDFANVVDAKVYNLFKLPFNPFSITVTPNSKPMLPLHIASAFRDTIAKAFNLGNKQVATLRDCIMSAYEAKGIYADNPSTWDKTPPVLSDVFNIYQNSESFKEDSLYSVLSDLEMFHIFEDDATKTVPLYDMIEGVTVINLQSYDPSIQNLVVDITLDLFYSQMQANGHSIIDGKLRQLKKIILVDEADNFLKMGFSSVKKILKEGREFGVGTILSTQFLRHFNTQQDDFSKYILSWIVHQVDELSTKEVKNLFNTNSKSEEEELFSLIKSLKKHYSIVRLANIPNPCYIEDRAFWKILAEENR